MTPIHLCRRRKRWSVALICVVTTTGWGVRSADAVIPPCPGDCDGNGVVIVAELVRGVHAALGDAQRCVAFDVDGDTSVDVGELIGGVGAALDGCPAPDLVPFAATLEPGGGALLITPTTPLHPQAAYALVLTAAVRGLDGQPLRADAEFRSLAGVEETGAEGPVALYQADLELAGNPYPDARLLRPDGTVDIPDRFALREMQDTEGNATARAILRRVADEVGSIRGFSTTGPARIALSAPVDLSTVTPQTVLFFQRSDGAFDLDGTLAEASRCGVPPDSIAIAITFPTQEILQDLLAARAVLLERAEEDPFEVVLEDPDLADDLSIGVFGPDDPEAAEFLAANPEVSVMARGLLRSLDFRGADETFDAAKLNGETPAGELVLDFLVTLPRGAGPHPVVIVQHGFGGSNDFVFSLGGELAREGLAAIGISAVSHGPRGSPLDLLQAAPLRIRDIFRQSSVDFMAVVRAVEAGIDLDADGSSDLAAEGIGYLGVSMGGLIGSTFIAVEKAIQAAVLNVTGGRLAFLAQSPGTREIYTSFLADEAALEVESEEFEVFLRRILDLSLQGMDKADGLNFAQRWVEEPLPGYAPRRVLMQEGIGDVLVSNESTEELAAAAGLIGDTPMSSPSGVSGLWRFEPPGGHGILGRADVRGQAIEFLASRGTNIIVPQP